MQRKNYFLYHGPLASSEKMARLAINPDWTCNTRDPRNARYLRPLSIAADEKMANAMADIIYGAVFERHGDDRTFNFYRQCLLDSRRMLRDREFWELVAREEDFEPPLQ